MNEAELPLRSAEEAYKAGRGGQGDVLAERGALARVRDRASEVGRRVQNARIALGRGR